MKYVSGRVKDLKVGISNYSEDKFSLDIVGIVTAGSYTTGSSSLHSTGADIGTLNVTGISTFGGNIDANGDLNVSGVSTFSDDINIPDNVFVRIGSATDGDFKLTHANNKTIARQHGSGSFVLDLLGDNKSFVVTKSNLSEKVAEFTTNQSVDLYYNNTQRFSTSGIGATVFGQLDATTLSGTLQTVAQPNVTSLGTLSSLNVTGDVSIGGTLTYEDVTNIDSIGLITARTGLKVLAGGADITGHTELDNINVSGVVTATNFAITPTGQVNMGGNLSQTNYPVQITTVHANEKISFYRAQHDDLSDEGAGIAFSRKDNGANLASGLFSHSNGGLGVAAIQDIVFLTGGPSSIQSTNEALRITSSGKVGIGTDNPSALMHLHGSSPKLYFTDTDTNIESQIDNDSGGGNFAINVDVNNVAGSDANFMVRFNQTAPVSAAKFLVNQTGNVGIGTGIPTGPKALTNNTAILAVGIVTTNSLFSSDLKVPNNGSLTLTNSNPGNAILDITNEGNGNVSGINFTRERSDGSSTGGSIFMPSNTSNNEAFLYIQTQSAGAQAGQTGTLSANNGVRLKLHGDDGIFSLETGDSERLRIISDGRIGIGTDNPSQELTVYGNNPIISVQEASASSQVDIGTGTVQGFINIQKSDGQRTVQISSNGDTYFTGGDVGIGDQTPDSRLHVTSSDNVVATFERTGSTYGARIAFVDALTPPGSPAYIEGYNGELSLGASGSSLMHFSTANDGRIGIGTINNTDFLLTIQGSTNVDGALNVTGISTFSDTVKVGTGVTALTNGNVSIGGTFEIFESSGIANRNFSQFKLSNFSISQHQNTGSYFIKNSSTGQLIIGGGAGGNGGIALYNNILSAKYLRTHSEGSVEIFHDNVLRFETSGIGATVYGQLDATGAIVTGILTATSFSGDGSGLTGITAEGSGVAIQNDGSPVGTAQTINFSTNLTASFSGGTATITGSGGGSGISTSDINSNRITTGTLNVTGISTFQGNIILPDGVSAKFGTDLDGEVKHTGSNLQIQETTGNIQITNYANDNDVVISTDDGSGGTATYFKADGSTGETILYNYGNEKIRTTGYGVSVTGNLFTGHLNATLDGNTSISLQDTGHGFAASEMKLSNGGRDLNIIAPVDIRLLPQGGEKGVEIIGNGAVTLHFNDNPKIATTNTGVDITGNVVSSGNISGVDATFSGVVTATSFQSTVATGTAPFVVASTTLVTNLNADLLDGKSTANSKVGNSIVARNAAGGFVAGDVTFDNIVGAAATFNGNVSIAGTLTYEDVTNIDSIGIITARDGINVSGGGINVTGVSTFNDDVTFQTANGLNIVVDKSDNALEIGKDVKVKFYESLQIYRDNNFGFIDHVGGSALKIRTDTLRINDIANDHSMIHADRDSSVKLFFDNTKRLETTNTGVSITGNLNVTGITTVQDLRVKGNNILLDHGASMSGVTTIGSYYYDKLVINSVVNSSVYAGNDNWPNPAPHDMGWTGFEWRDGFFQGAVMSGELSRFDLTSAGIGSTHVNLTVQVATKSTDHRYHGQGSSLGYVIFEAGGGKSAIHSPFFTFTPGRKYRFDQSHNSNSTHQIKFYLEADRTTLYETGVTYNGTAGSSGAYTQIEITDETPSVLHYQCVNHAYMGNAVQTNSNVVNTNYNAILRGDLDVDGHTNLDNVSISGVTTVSGSVTAEDLILIKNNPTITLTDNNNNPDYQIGNINGVLRFQDTTNSVTRFAVGTDGNIDISGDLDVDGHTELDNVNVSGIITSAAATVNGETILNGNVSFYGSNYGAIWRKTNSRFQLNDNAELTFGSGTDTTIKHNNSHLLITNTTGNIDVTGNVLLNNDLDVDGHTNLDNVSISGVTTFASNLTISGDGSNNSMITESGSGNLFIKADDAIFNNAAGSTFLGKFNSDGLTIPGDIVHSSDTNTKIGFPGNDQFTVTTAGYARMEFVGDYIYINSQQTGNNRALMYNYPAGAGYRGALGFYGTVSTSVADSRNITFNTNGNTQKLEINPDGLKVTGICTATSFEGDGSGLTGIAITSTDASFAQVEWDVVNNSSSSYRFTGPGNDGAEDNPDIYLVRGQKYIFNVNASGHPFLLRVSSGGSNYTDGVTNNGAQSGQVIINVQHDAPAQLVYQCQYHGGMVGNIYIVGQHLTNGANNRLVTATSAYGLNGESGLTYNGSTIFAHTGTGYKELHVNSSTTNSATLRLQNSQANYTLSNVAGGSFSIADSGGTRFTIQNGHTTIPGSVSIGGTLTYEDVTNIDSVGIITARSNIDAQDSINLANSIIHAGDTNTQIRFPAADTITAETAGTERLRITSAGSVGIGTDDPTSKFDVHMSDKSGVNFLNVGNNSAIDLKSNQVESCGRIQVSESVNGGVMILSTKNTSGDLTERLRITSGGNIGINSTSPTHKLEVLGDSSLKGNLTVSGVLTATSFSGDGSNLTGVTTTGDVQDITGIATGIGTFISNAGSLTNIDSFAYASTDYKTAEYTLHFMNGANIQAQKLLVMQDGTNVYSNSYGVMASSNLLVSIGSTIGGGNVYVNVTDEVGVSGVTTYRWRREVQE